MENSKIQQEEIQTSSIDILAILKLFWNSKKKIGMIVGVVTVLAIAYSLILPETFISTAVLLPESDKSKMASLGGLSDLASLAGVNVGGEGSLVKLYPTIIKSEAVLKDVIYHQYQTKKYSQPVNLIEYWKIEAKTREMEYEAALKSLRTGLDIQMDNKTNVITLTIETNEAQLSADILNTVIAGLDKFIREKKTTNATKQREFVEGRLADVKHDLEKSEDQLKTFRETNRQVGPSSPSLLLQQERLIRDVQINVALFTELRKQQEIVKIEEVKNLPIINVMDPARPAARKDKPKRAIIVLTSFFLSAIAGLGYVFVRQQYGNTIANLITDFKNK